MEEIIIGGIVLYNPKIDCLLKTIDSIQNQCHKILLYLNSPISDIFFLKDLYPNKIEIFGNGANMGLGYAHNKLIKESSLFDGDYLILSDQDTIYPSNFTYEMLEFKDQNFTIACPAWIDINDKSLKVVDQYFLLNNQLYRDNTNQSRPMAHAISSGMFVNLKKLDGTILPDNDLFIDWIDNDWCWRLISSGQKIIYNPKVVLNHNLGNTKIQYSILTFTKRNHIRDYYIIRNMLYILIYKKYNINVKPYLIKKFIHHSLLSVMSSERNIHTRIWYLFCALKDGALGKLGPLNK
jgi:rhamnosyltransferase